MGSERGSSQFAAPERGFARSASGTHVTAKTATTARAGSHREIVHHQPPSASTSASGRTGARNRIPYSKTQSPPTQTV